MDLRLSNLFSLVSPNHDGFTRIPSLADPFPHSISLVSNRSSYLDGNSLTSSIPPEIGYLAAVETISLTFNSLTGTIPTELGLATSLRELYLDFNQLTGPLPTQLGSLTMLESVWVDENELTGTLPSELGNLSSLRSLALEGNRFDGVIPSSLGSLTNWGTSNTMNLSGKSLESIGRKEVWPQKRRLTCVFLLLHSCSHAESIYLERNNFSDQDLDPIFCPLVDPNAELWADCVSEVICTCCTTCCSRWLGCDEGE
jgi:Leucine-rich repeat (LRR) protein